MVNAKTWNLVRYPTGMPTKDDFTCKEEALPPCKDGDVIVEAVCLTVDPYMRFMISNLSLGDTIMGEQVARVIESKNPEWPVGSHMLIYVGWRTHTHLSAADLQGDDNRVQRLPELGTLPKSLSLGLLGMPGNTAYLGFMEVMQPKPGETVLVNGAAGAVGSAVVQLAKIAGCKVIAFAGTDEKVAWLKELGSDFAFNYKTVNVGEALAEAAPEKINIYFDNVGGKFTAEALSHMANFGRVLICGAISTYNEETVQTSNNMNSPFNEGIILVKELTVRGFMVYNHKDRFEDSIKQMKKWVDEGRLQYRESVVHGFDNMFEAFLGLFHGANIGKAVVIP